MYNIEFEKEAGLGNRISNLVSRSKGGFSRRFKKTQAQKNKRIRNENFTNEMKEEISKSKGRARERAYDRRIKDKKRRLRKEYHNIENDNTRSDKVKNYLRKKVRSGDAEKAVEPTFLEQHGGKILAGTAAAGAAGGGYYIYKKKKREAEARRMGYRN